MAARRGNAEAVNLLLSRGADVNAKADNGTTALFAAASRGHGEIVSLLLSNGADVDAERTDGETALLQGSRNGHGEVASLLLSSGADVNVQSNDGMTTLLAATVNRHAEVFSLLLSYWEAANAQAEDNTLLAEDDPRLVVVREWSGAVKTYMQCEPGESVFYGETFVPCGSTFKNYRNQIGGGMVFAGARRGPEDPCKSLADFTAYARAIPESRFTSALERARSTSSQPEQICREALAGLI